ncbi:unnamed protein product [Spirodela intermedia]|uniref:Uncharacterized protein n=1 Tax=Spirodela intermedia TaxID=51605 RepID=A0A7I8IWI7_SPIIN|nr:unnamed protein product [Spirodela intermedia]CAA6662348.1 unnamed protein product [Spirodela intermedia]
MAELVRGVVLLSAVLQALTLCSACSFIVSNNCPHTIWPATLAGAGLRSCFFDEHGEGTCQTGDCGGKLQCGGMAALPPATLFEITLATSSSGRDFYDVSLVDGYNLPVYATPRGGGAACNATGCISDLNSGCPQELQVEVAGGDVVVACRSACEAFGLDEYCCSGEYADPTTCRPSAYSALFKAACPRAYSYAFDDSTSTFTCKAPSTPSPSAPPPPGQPG